MISKFTFKGILSLTLLLLFIVVTISGIGLFFAPTGKIAKEIAWTFFGLNKFSLEKIHTLSGFIFSFLILIHFSLNFNMFKNELFTLFRTSKK